VLWRRGGSTVRELHQELAAGAAGQGGAYTTTLTMLQVMTEKGLVRKEETPGSRAHVYHAASAEAETQQSLLKDLLNRAFDGNVKKLVMHALSADGVSQKEIDKVKQMLEKLEDRK